MLDRGMEGYVCPYLRGRHQSYPVLEPDEDNQCILTASIHLPRSQQSRFCLGGNHARCSRYQRHGDRPVPPYVTGIRPAEVNTEVPVPDLPLLVWRRPWFRRMLRVLVVLVLALAVVLAWRWRVQTMPHRITPVPTLPPTPVLPVLTPTPNPYLQPTQGPAVR
ncbi:MAG: hypothetical protein D6775_12095 [Caldilineae bacterium]|nr:MAG: hypothetical protein D6775_12095 [Caldilineae bacterium]